MIRRCMKKQRHVSFTLFQPDFDTSHDAYKQSSDLWYSLIAPSDKNNMEVYRVRLVRIGLELSYKVVCPNTSLKIKYQLLVTVLYQSLSFPLKFVNSNGMAQQRWISQKSPPVNTVLTVLIGNGPILFRHVGIS